MREVTLLYHSLLASLFNSDFGNITLPLWGENGPLSHLIYNQIIPRSHNWRAKQSSISSIRKDICKQRVAAGSLDLSVGGKFFLPAWQNENKNSASCQQDRQRTKIKYDKNVVENISAS